MPSFPSSDPASLGRWVEAVSELSRKEHRHPAVTLAVGECSGVGWDSGSGGIHSLYFCLHAVDWPRLSEIGIKLKKTEGALRARSRV